jgi:hypothetical protein
LNQCCGTGAKKQRASIAGPTAEHALRPNMAQIGILFKKDFSWPGIFIGFHVSQASGGYRQHEAGGLFGPDSVRYL